MEEAYFAKQLMDWYQKHKRRLPWRHTKNPYLIWLSEVILQQTRVAQGLPYFHKFVQAFPTIYDLAAASEQEVLRLWQGLGYYSRARNLHACAKVIVDQYQGKFPESYSELLKLKGIGVYTAAAIASFSFNETVPVVDGNVYRVLSRVFGVKEDIASGSGQKKFRQLAARLVPKGQADVYNQAIMEFGALQCTPLTPACLLCPLNTMCYAYEHGKQRELPVKVKRLKIKQRFLHYFVIRQNGSLWMRQRVGKDIWSGLFDFYLLESSADKTLENLMENEQIMQFLTQKGVSIEVSKVYKHQLTHQQLFIIFYIIDIAETCLAGTLIAEQQLKMFTKEEVKNLPKPILINNFLYEEIF